MVAATQDASAADWLRVVRGSTRTAEWAEWMRVEVEGVQVAGIELGIGMEGTTGMPGSRKTSAWRRDMVG